MFARLNTVSISNSLCVAAAGSLNMYRRQAYRRLQLHLSNTRSARGGQSAVARISNKRSKYMARNALREGTWYG